MDCISRVTFNEFSSRPTTFCHAGCYPTFHKKPHIVNDSVLRNLCRKIERPVRDVEPFRILLLQSITTLLNKKYDTKVDNRISRTVNSLWILFSQIDRVMYNNRKYKSRNSVTLWYTYLVDGADRSKWMPFIVECKFTAGAWVLSFEVLAEQFALRTVSTHSSVVVSMELALLVSFVFRNITRELEMKFILNGPASNTWELRTVQNMYNAYKHENMHEEAHRSILSTMANFLLYLLAQAKKRDAQIKLKTRTGPWSDLLDAIQTPHWKAINDLVDLRCSAFLDGDIWMICPNIQMRDKNKRCQEIKNGTKNPMQSAKWKYGIQNISDQVADLDDILHFTGEWANNQYAIF